MLLNATAVLLAAALSLAAPAANLEIPASVLTQEARSRAALTSAERERARALEGRLSSKLSIGDVNALVRGEASGVAFAVLVAYIKILQREARADRTIARSSAEQALAAKEGKLELEKAKIEAMKREAAERFDHAMSAASMEMAMGIVSCAAAAASAVGGVGFAGPGTARAPAGAVVLTPTPLVVRGVLVPTKTPTKTPGAGK